MQGFWYFISRRFSCPNYESCKLLHCMIGGESLYVDQWLAGAPMNKSAVASVQCIGGGWLTVAVPKSTLKSS